MRKNNLILAFCALVLVFSSCKNESDVYTKIIDFEDVVLGEDSIWNGSDLSGTPTNDTLFGFPVTNYYGSFTSDSAKFENVYAEQWFSWSGFACSAKIDTVTSGIENQYSVMAGSGAYNSQQFALAYDSATIVCPANAIGNFKVKSIMLTNSTYAYKAMLDGSDFNRAFSQANAGDWFKVIIKGYLSTTETGSIDYYLADFRNGKSFISKAWEKVDLSSLGEVDRISFTFDSSDKAYGLINNPVYVCIDNIEFEQTTETIK